jgi:hypothetical protein
MEIVGIYLRLTIDDINLYDYFYRIIYNFILTKRSTISEFIFSILPILIKKLEVYEGGGVSVCNA